MKDCKCHYCSGGSYDPDYIDLLEEQCKKCGHELYRADCWNGCDDGYFDGYEEDPLWYDQGDLIPCAVCHGDGCIIFCPGCELKEKEAVVAGRIGRKK